jgi:hypothetical protein
VSALKTSLDSIVLQDRDLGLLRGLFESRVMTAAHITTLFFDGKAETAKKRLQKLKTAGLVTERPRRPSEPAILFLTRKAFGVLRAQGILEKYPQLGLTALERRAEVKDLTIRHELEVMDVKSAFHAAIRKTRAFSLIEFTTWPLLHEFEVAPPGYGGKSVLVKPDGFIRIHEEEPDGGVSGHPPFFLEVDRGGELQEILTAKAGRYLEYYRSGGFAEKQGAPRAAFKEYPFRVLMVFKSAERRNNTAERLLLHRPPILSQVCLSTLKEVTADPLGAIWIQPRDYHIALQGTPFDPERRRATREYRSQPEREALVERKINKIRILSG